MNFQTKIKWFDITDSTNTQLNNDKGGLTDKNVYAALFQTAGRGQRGNRWESGKAMNLTFSILFKPTNIAANQQFIISEIVTLGIVDYMRSHGLAATIKWPNDIYINDLKICGILIENTVMGDKLTDSIAGIGVNLNQTEFCSDAPNPTSLSIMTGRQYDVRVELDCILSYIFQYYDMTDYSSLEEKYLDIMYRRGEFHKYTDCTTGMEFTAKIIGIDKTACLVTEHTDGSIHSYAFKEIKYIL
ncbi:MAG: biotin--[acetyl-CoA-carboxylase] ligase [Bacteroidales bacterium]|nr:biotin--[acetyl-CoA-carboxylase] ligase [Bacteroidales bacterium]MDD4670411.1 biotin--[acetyl-CoA-carboxylase] ligase [Bacteroidales bacterium]